LSRSWIDLWCQVWPLTMGYLWALELEIGLLERFLLAIASLAYRVLWLRPGCTFCGSPTRNTFGFEAEVRGRVIARMRMRVCERCMWRAGGFIPWL